MVGLVRGLARGEQMLAEILTELGGRPGKDGAEPPILDYARLRAAIPGRALQAPHLGVVVEG